MAYRIYGVSFKIKDDLVGQIPLMLTIFISKVDDVSGSTYYHSRTFFALWLLKHALRIKPGNLFYVVGNSD